MARYIDLDRLAPVQGYESCDDDRSMFLRIEDVRQALLQAEADTPEVAPVIRAHWIMLTEQSETGAGAKCSNCGECYDAVDDTAHWKLFCETYRFCPHCGARMEADT